MESLTPNQQQILKAEEYLKSLPPIFFEGKGKENYLFPDFVVRILDWTSRIKTMPEGRVWDRRSLGDIYRLCLSHCGSWVKLERVILVMRGLMLANQVSSIICPDAKMRVYKRWDFDEGRVSKFRGDKPIDEFRIDWTEFIKDSPIIWGEQTISMLWAKSENLNFLI